MVKRPMYPGQLAAFRYAKYHSAIALYLEMRLGKTLVAIRWVRSRRRAKRVLVLCPRVVFADWGRELELESATYTILRGSVAQRAIDAKEIDCQFYVTNYEAMAVKRRPGESKKLRPSALALLPWDAVILDESTIVKSPRARITKVVLRYLSNARYRAVLSGLPNPEGNEDFVTQMLFLFGEFMGCRSYWVWQQQYCRPFRFGYWLPTKTRPIVREAVRNRSFFLSRKNAGMAEIKVYERRTVAIPAKIRQLMKIAKRDYELFGEAADNILTVMTWLHRLAGGVHPDERGCHLAKMDELIHLATGELSGQPIVVWARFNAEVEAIAYALNQKDIETDTIIGGQDNTETIREFQAGEFQAIVCQSKCARMGVNLSCADTAIIYSNYWDLQTRAQAEDRIVRVGKKSPLLIVDLIAEDTIDSDIVEALTSKAIEPRLMMDWIAERQGLKT